jgi:hypothetical protein
MTKRQPSRLARALLETADDMYRTGVMDGATYEKITMRYLGDQAADGSTLLCCAATGERSLK